MRVYINGNLVTLDVDDPDTVKVALLSRFEATPTSIQLGGITNLAALPQDKMTGVQEKGYLVIQTDSPEEIHIAGTVGLLHCIGISLYDPVSKKLVIAHFDIGNDPAQLQILLNEFKSGANLEMRFFGGMCREQLNVELEAPHEDSKKLLNNLLYFLYKNAEGELQVNIISNDTFEKLAAFKHEVLQRNRPGKINFAIDCRTGNLIQRIEEDTPYTITIDRCGLFSGIYQTRGVCPRMHRYLNEENDKLFKWLDTSSPEASTECHRRLNEACEFAMIRILMIELAVSGYAVNNPRAFTDRMLMSFIHENMSALINDISSHSPLQIVLDHACVITFNNAKQSLSACPYRSIDELPLMRLLNKGDIQRWCANNIRDQIIQLVCKDEESGISLLRELRRFTGSLDLLEDCIKHQRMSIESRQGDSTNLLMLLTQEGSNFHHAVEIWLKNKIDIGINRFTDIIGFNLQPPFNHPEIRPFIHETLIGKFHDFHRTACNLDIFHPKNIQATDDLRRLGLEIQARLEVLEIEIAQARSAEPRTEQSFLSRFCCGPSSTPAPTNATQAIIERARGVITDMINTYFNALLQPVSLAPPTLLAAAAAAMPPTSPSAKK